MENIQKEIEKRAYELFLERGGKPGHAMEDWMKAEKEVRAKKETAFAKPSSPQQEGLVKTAYIAENKQNSIKKQDPTVAKKSGKIHQGVRV